MSDSVAFRVEDLKGYVTRFFTALNVPEIDALIAADVLVSADLRGINSHGVIRLHRYYVDRLRKGQIDPLSPIKTLNESPSTLSLDILQSSITPTLDISSPRLRSRTSAHSISSKRTWMKPSGN